MLPRLIMGEEKQATPGPSGRERRNRPRTSAHFVRDLLYDILRFIARHIRGFWGALATFFTVGILAGVLAATGFVAFAGAVYGGLTQGIDETVLQWFERRRAPLLDEIMLEITSLGNSVVLVMIVAVASVLLWLTHHRWSVYVLLVGVIGGQILNNVLKEVFARERPSIIEWGDHVSTYSFPSGHAMSAAIAYGCVAYLVARLEPTRTLRRVTWGVALLIIVAIGMSRMYLGVHYPSDVLAGFFAGAAWLAFVASSVTAIRFFAPRRPETVDEEHGLDEQPVEAA